MLRAAYVAAAPGIGMRHAPGIELLDDPHADPDAVRRSLRNIARSNRMFGGTDAVLWGLGRLLGRSTPDARRPKHALTLLDLGTGAGDIPCAVRRWGRARGTPIRSFGLERLRAAANLAGSAELPVAVGCASTLPFATGSVDLVTISQLLHHCDPDSAATLLREAARVARCGIVIADLLRSATAAALFGVASWALGFDRHTRADGMTSVARGYTEEELRNLCAGAGLAMDVTVRPGWRIVAWGSARPVPSGCEG